MKKWGYLVLLLCITHWCASQNLIFAGNFENVTGQSKIYGRCRYVGNLSNLYKDTEVQGMYSVRCHSAHILYGDSPWVDFGLPIYNYKCPITQPNDAVLRTPASGYGYTFFSDAMHYKRGEYLAQKSRFPLKKGIMYELAAMTSLGGPIFLPTYGKYSRPFSINNALGVVFSTENLIVDSANGVITHARAMQVPQLIDDTGWKEVKWIFKADSAYTWVTYGTYYKNYAIITKDWGGLTYLGKDRTFFLDSVTLKPQGMYAPLISGDTVFCKGRPLHFINNTKENVVWEQDGKVLSIDSIHTCTASTDFTLMAWNSKGVWKKRIKIINDFPAPTISQKTEWCNNTIALEATKGLNDKLTWLPENKVDTILFVSDTSHRWLVVEFKNCIDTFKVSINHLCVPDIGNDTVVCLGDYLTLKNKKNEPSDWYVGSVFQYTGSTITIGPVLSKSTVTARNKLGADSLHISINENCIDDFKIWIPDAFTPDGNALNDNFQIATNRPAKILIHAYNRYGVLVYEGDNSGWNGVYKNRSLQGGFYLVSVDCEYKYNNQNKKITKRKMVLLLK
jgi:gliding motility-associated-like protein